MKNIEMEQLGQGFVNQINKRLAAEKQKIKKLEEQLKIINGSDPKWRGIKSLIDLSHGKIAAYLELQGDFLWDIKTYEDINIKLYEVEEG